MFSKTLWMSIVTGMVAATAFGQIGPRATHSTSATATTDCQSTYKSGSNPGFLEFCVTANGNIAEFQGPSGYEHIRFGGVGEGYGVCDYDNKIRYYDYAGGDSGNWQNAVRTQPGGLNTFPLKIVRASSDGAFVLTQAFSRNAGERIAKIAMTLKNTGSSPKTFILLRFANVNANNAHGGDFNNTFDSGVDAAWAYNTLQYGVRLSTVANSFEHVGFVDVTNDGPDPCNPLASSPPGQPFFGDGSVGMAYVIPLAAGKSAMISVEYKRF
jgi:hypothetical protein